MNKTILFVLLITLSGAHAISIEEVFGMRHYSIPSVHIAFDVNPDGSARVAEEFTYTFSGCFREVYRTYNRGDYRVTDVDGVCEADCEFHDRGYEWAVSFGEICDTTTLVTFTYTIENFLRTDNDDNTIFSTMLVGREFTRTFDEFTAHITFPHTVQEVFVNPYRHRQTYVIEENALRIDIDRLNTWLEVRGALAASEELHTAAPDSLQEIRSQQQRYTQEIFALRAAMIFGILIVLVCGALIAKRLFSLTERMPYWREFPTTKPYFVNFLFRYPHGRFSTQSVTATLLDFAHKNIITLTDNKRTTIQFNQHNHSLDKFEQAVYDVFKKHSTQETFSFENQAATRKLSADIRKLLHQQQKKYFSQYKKSFRVHAQTSFFFASVSALAAIALIFVSPDVLVGAQEARILAQALLVVYIALAIVRFRRINDLIIYDEKYQELAEKVFAYKRFITDLTLLKQHPPASVAIWDEHLVYATALHCTRQVEKNMKIVDPQASNNALRATTLHTSMRAATTTSSSSRGGVGRSSGGGGGGAR